MGNTQPGLSAQNIVALIGARPQDLTKKIDRPDAVVYRLEADDELRE
jgi:hypothetical protein